MKRAGDLLALVFILILAACGRSPEEVAQVNEQVATAGAETRAALPTNTPAPTTEVTEAPTTEAAATPEDAGTAQLVGDATRGQTLFNQSFNTATGAWMCSNCHSAADNRLVGPGLAGISERAATRVEGQDATQYVTNSILHPNDFIVPADAGGPYPASLMPANYADLLTEQDVADLVAYLFTLQ